MQWEHLAESDKEQNVSVAVTNHRNIDLSETRREKNSTELKFSSSTDKLKKPFLLTLSLWTLGARLILYKFSKAKSF